MQQFFRTSVVLSVFQNMSSRRQILRQRFRRQILRPPPDLDGKVSTLSLNSKNLHRFEARHLASLFARVHRIFGIIHLTDLHRILSFLDVQIF